MKKNYLAILILLISCNEYSVEKYEMYNNSVNQSYWQMMYVEVVFDSNTEFENYRFDTSFVFTKENIDCAINILNENNYRYILTTDSILYVNHAEIGNIYEMKSFCDDVLDCSISFGY